MDQQPCKCAICRKPAMIRAMFSKGSDSDCDRIMGWFSVPEGWWVRTRASELVQIWDIVCPDCYVMCRSLATDFLPIEKR